VRVTRPHHRAVSPLPAFLAELVPALCPACGRSCRPGATLCTRCHRRLGEAKPLVGRGGSGLDRVWSSAPHQGVARDLVSALKFRRLLPVAGLMAERIEWLAPASLLSGAVVPVPSTRLRSLGRGFDPAAEIAAALARRLGAPPRFVLSRADLGRQLGRGRAQRIGQPPHVRVCGEAPRSVLLIDDVMTTGTTLAACARALRGGGSIRVAAITFTRRP
jgi:predicted amidophosphoribosyltransferase